MDHGTTPTIAAIPHPPTTRLGLSMSQPSHPILSYPDLPIINLTPGKLLITNQATLVSTILGSCVSLCLHNKKFRVGAICHGLLPRQTNLPMIGAFPYVDTAVAHMLETMANRFDLAPSDLTVKLFGGASVLQTTIPCTDELAVGQQNITAALETLTRFGLTPDVQKTGGTEGYKIFFNTDTGEVFVRRIAPSLTRSFAQTMRKQSAH